MPPLSKPSSNSNSRVDKPISGRRAGTISISQFKANIARFSHEELAELAAALLEDNPAMRTRLKRALIRNSEPAQALVNAG